MKINSMRCKACHQEMTLCRLTPMSGEDEGVRVAIDGMPAMQCGGGHRRFVAPEFAVEMMDNLLDDNALMRADAAIQKGLLRKRMCCPGCGTELAAVPADTVAARRLLDFPGLESFAVVIEIPKFHCGKCGRKCIAPVKTVVDRLMTAAANAFRAAQVTPT